MATYGHDFARLKQAFVDFTLRLPFYGTAVVCAEDANVRAILPAITKPVVTYGFNEGVHIRAVDVAADGTRMHFRVRRQANGTPGVMLPELDVTLNLAGRHNVLNALAAVAVGMEVGAADDAIVRALAEFAGVGRRFQRYGEIALPGGGGFALIDDYGHHPVEMAATLAAVRGAFPGRRVVLAFQPHRYTRTRDVFDDFVNVLSTVDVLVLTEVYPAGEAPIVAADGRALARAIRVLGKVEPIFVAQVADVPQALLNVVRDGDVVVTMGAGAIGTIPARLAAWQPRLVGGTR
jgi:UDP-N-acetylmuramate--alanine ligase